MCVIDSSLSDHKQIYFEIKRIKPQRLKRVQYEAINYIGFYNTVKHLIAIDLDTSYNTFESILMQALAKNKVLKTKILNPPSKDWINKTLINAINDRNTHWHSFKQNPEDNNLKERFKQSRNLAQLNIQSAKSHYYHTAFSNCKSNPLKMWQLINNLAHITTTSKYIPSKLSTSNGTITNITEICEQFNVFFSSIGSKLASKITNRHNNTAFSAKNCQQNTKTLLKFKPTTACVRI